MGIGSSLNSTIRFWRVKISALVLATRTQKFNRKQIQFGNFKYYHLVKDYQRRPPSPILAIYNSIFLLIIGYPLFIRNIRLGCPRDDTATERKVKGGPLHSQNNGFSVFSLFFQCLWKIL